MGAEQGRCARGERARRHPAPLAQPSCQSERVYHAHAKLQLSASDVSARNAFSQSVLKSFDAHEATPSTRLSASAKSARIPSLPASTTRAANSSTWMVPSDA